MNNQLGSYLAVIKVVGIGGGGTNAVSRMVDAGVSGVEFIAVNTDAQALLMTDADVKIHIGSKATPGPGGGAGPLGGLCAGVGRRGGGGAWGRPSASGARRRAEAAEQGIQNLRERVDTLIVIENDRLLQVVEKRTPVTEAFRMADDILRQGVQGITDLITVPGLVNLDFADVRTIMRDAGSALMGGGGAGGGDRA